MSYHSLQGLNVGLLANNVGMSYDHPEFFLEIQDGATRGQAMVDCNINSMLKVTRAVLPAMVARRRGAVINLSSFSAFGAPLLSVYSACKAFVLQWSTDLELEYSGKGITVMYTWWAERPRVRRPIPGNSARLSWTPAALNVMK